MPNCACFCVRKETDWVTRTCWRSWLRSRKPPIHKGELRQYQVSSHDKKQFCISSTLVRYKTKYKSDLVFFRFHKTGHVPSPRHTPGVFVHWAHPSHTCVRESDSTSQRSAGVPIYWGLCPSQCLQVCWKINHYMTLKIHGKTLNTQDSPQKMNKHYVQNMEYTFLGLM